MASNKPMVKMLLKDWMTATTQIMKVSNPTVTAADISFWWRAQMGIRMNEKYVGKCLNVKDKLEPEPKKEA